MNAHHGRQAARSVLAAVASTGILLAVSACSSGSAPESEVSDATTASTPAASASPLEAGADADGPAFRTALSLDEEVPLGEDGTVTVTVPALEVTGGSERDRSCFSERESDLGIMDFYLDAAVDIESLRMRLTDAQGVRLVGPPVLIPAVNRGGSIPFGGSVDWDDRVEVLGEQKFIDWRSRQSTRFATITAGDSYLVLLRLRPTADRVSFDGLRVDYEVATPDDAGRGGPRFTAEASTDARWRIVERSRNCS